MVSILEMSFIKLQINQTLQQLWHGKNSDVLHWENISVYNIMSSYLRLSAENMKLSEVTATYEYGRVLDHTAHILSRASWAIELQPLAVRCLSLSLSLSLCSPLPVTNDGGRVLDVSAHLLSRAFVSHSLQPLAVSSLSLSLSLSVSARHTPSFLPVSIEKCSATRLRL
jgi:hypothetical protein